MKAEYRMHTPEVKAAFVKRIHEGEQVPALSKEFNIHDSLGYTWVRKAEGRDKDYHALAKKAAAKKKPKKVVRAAALQIEKTNGRMDAWVKGERATLLAMIGELTVEVARLKRK